MRKDYILRTLVRIGPDRAYLYTSHFCNCYCHCCCFVFLNPSSKWPPNSICTLSFDIIHHVIVILIHSNFLRVYANLKVGSLALLSCTLTAINHSYIQDSFDQYPTRIKILPLIPMSINADQFLSIPNWEALRGISDQCHDFDRHWALIEGVLYFTYIVRYWKSK